jgi:hypothetical protein
MASAHPYRTMPDRRAAPSGLLLVATVFLAWLVVASLLGGASFAALTAHALAPFGGIPYAAGVTAIALLRVLAAPAAASAAGIAVVVSTHDSSTGELRRAWAPWRVYAVRSRGHPGCRAPHDRRRRDRPSGLRCRPSGRVARGVRARRAGGCVLWRDVRGARCGGARWARDRGRAPIRGRPSVAHGQGRGRPCRDGRDYGRGGRLCRRIRDR